MRIKEIIEEARRELLNNNFEDSGIIARELLCHVLDKNKQYLVINMDEEVEEEKHKKYLYNLKEIIEGKPLQYITNKQEFMGLEFYVDKNVLIPQPDTEILVESVLELCTQMSKEKIKILDLCTGSGAIAIALNKLLEKQNIKNEIIASDISKEALEVARKNNEINKTNVEFIQSNLFENIQESKFDIIVSNPPYIKEHIIKTLSKQVQCEPEIALSGGKDGLDFYRKIIEKAYSYMSNQGYLCLEIGYDQKKEVTNLLKKYNQYEDIKAIKDLSNNDRCIISKIML